MNKKYLKKYVNLNYFELPKISLKSKFYVLKYRLSVTKISSKLASIYICNKTSPLDKELLVNAIEGDYVFLKDSVIEKLYSNAYSEEELNNLKNSFERLKSYFISVVIFPERHTTIFGEFAKIPRKITDFIYDLNFEKIHFVNLIGSYFIQPIWTTKNRMCTTKIDSRFYINNLEDVEIPKSEFNMQFNKYMPSSASTYSKKYPVYVRSNELACDFEKVFYICPNCKEFLSLYSEYNCVKCKNCGNPFEFNDNYEINLSKYFKNLDEAKKFQYEYLITAHKTDDAIIKYSKIFYKNIINEQSDLKNETDLNIFSDKIEYFNYDEFVKISYQDIDDIYLTYNNILNIKLKNVNNMISFQGKKKENLYIIIDLYNIYFENLNNLL